jgi:hypothetical protein
MTREDVGTAHCALAHPTLAPARGEANVFTLPLFVIARSESDEAIQTGISGWIASLRSQ